MNRRDETLLAAVQGMNDRLDRTNERIDRTNERIDTVINVLAELRRPSCARRHAPSR